MGSAEGRIDHIKLQVRKAFRKVLPDIVVIEGHSFGSKGSAGSVLHEMHGVVKNFLYRNEAPFVLKAPMTVKKFATGNGHATKQEMIFAAKAQGFPECWNDDVADAFFCARYGVEHYHALINEEGDDE